MARRIIPTLSYDAVHGRHIRQTYTRYADLKKHILDHIANSIDGLVCVNRPRRGEWGEWFEYWSLVNGKPKIVREGWM